jgi:hypothetical protein
MHKAKTGRFCIYSSVHIKRLLKLIHPVGFPQNKEAQRVYQPFLVLFDFVQFGRNFA